MLWCMCGDTKQWAAGMYVGEGTCFVTRGLLVMKIAMQDERAISRYVEAFSDSVPDLTHNSRSLHSAGMWYVSHPTRTKPMYETKVSGERALHLAEAMLPLILDTDKGDQLIRCLRQLAGDRGGSTTERVESIITEAIRKRAGG